MATPTDKPKRGEQLETFRQRLEFLNRTDEFGNVTSAPFLSEADDFLLRQAAQILKRIDESPNEFSVTPIVSMQDGRGKLDVVWRGLLTQMSPVDARATAWALLEAASLAESEEAVVRFLKGELHLDATRAAAVLAEFRRYRDTAPSSSLVGLKPNA